MPHGAQNDRGFADVRSGKGVDEVEMIHSFFRSTAERDEGMAR